MWQEVIYKIGDTGRFNLGHENWKVHAECINMKTKQDVLYTWWSIKDRYNIYDVPWGIEWYNKMVHEIQCWSMKNMMVYDGWPLLWCIKDKTAWWPIKDGYSIMVREGRIQHDGPWRMDTTSWSIKNGYNILVHEGWIQLGGPWRMDTSILVHEGRIQTYWCIKDGYDVRARLDPSEQWCQDQTGSIRTMMSGPDWTHQNNYVRTRVDPSE